MAGRLAVYRSLLADAGARRFSLTGLVARMPLSMSGLGVVLLVSITHGSYARAGVITAVATITGAVVSPFWGRLIDRRGQAIGLAGSSIVFAAGIALLSWAVLTDRRLWLVLVSAVIVGFGVSQAGSSVRARWAYRLPDRLRLDVAYAFEAVLDEVVFITGPAIATFAATVIHPGLGLWLAGGFGLVGGLALAAQGGTQPPIGGRQAILLAHHPRRRPRLPWGRLAPLVVGCMCLGGVFGGMEIAIVAYAREAGILPLAGLFATAWAFGSMIAGLITGTIAWKSSVSRRVKVGSLLLALSLLPMPLIHRPVLLAALLIISGVFIAPTLIALTAVTQSSVPPARLSEALSWTQTGMAVGVAGSGAGLGRVIDLYGATGGLVGICVMGLLAALAALTVRSARGVLRDAATGADSSHRDGARLDEGHQDPAHREGTHRDGTHRDGAEEDAADEEERAR